ncbi:hypothetical protein [Rhodococcus sp. SGAir0479]|uniref:hypothetical protein n=1 Tax=Rhodococcus sp. SGAir0479 TaxID=2567884 RepID=UPI0020C81D2E|nr:hypothetical protein [Rhodococcus sp. SGAir0479]
MPTRRYETFPDRHVVDVSVLPGLSTGPAGVYGAGCTYVVVPRTPVMFGHAVTLWTPTAPGEHSIMAYQTSAGGPEETVTVDAATPLGPLCLVAP